MPTNNVLFRIQSLKEIENQINLQLFPEGGLPACTSRVGYEISHTEEDVSIKVKTIALYEGKIVMSYAIEGIFGFDEIGKYFDFETNQFTDKVGVLPTLLGIVIDALRGMQTLRLTDTPYEAVLPYINPTQLLEATHAPKK